MKHDHDHGHTDRFSESAATWDDDPGHVERARSVADVVRRVVPLRPDLHALEIGGGTGLLARALASDLGTVLVTDVAPGMVEAASQALGKPEYDGWAARRYDIEHDPVLDERFDLVLGQLALHHMGDIPAVIRRCAELLRPGGRVALVDLDRDAEGAFHQHVHDFDGHDGFTREDISAWLVQAGFDEVALTDAGHVEKAEGTFPMFLATGRLPD